MLPKFKNMSDNSRIVLNHTVVSFLIKGCALCLSLVTTPAFIRYFQDNRILGVWYTLLSVLTWFLNFDLGIGNGIRNNLVRDLSEKDYISARKTISSGLFSNAVIAIVLMLVGLCLLTTVDLNRLMHVEEQVISREILLKSSLLVFAGIMIRFFLSSISSVFYALQLSPVNNFLALCVSLLQLLLVLLVQPENPEQGLLILAGAYAFLSNLPMATAGVILFATKLKECRPSVSCVDRQHIRNVMGIGTVFFVCQITYMLLMNTNEFFISYLFGPQYTTEYTFYYKLTSLISMVISLLLTPIWSVITKAMAERQYNWVRNLYGKLKMVGIATMVLQFSFVLIQQFVMDLWLGKGYIRVDYMTAVAFACFGSVFVYTSILSTMVCGMARMRLQLVCYLLGVAVKIAIIFALHATVRNWVLVVWSNVLVLLPYCVVQQVDLDRYFLRLTAEMQEIH